MQCEMEGDGENRKWGEGKIRIWWTDEIRVEGEQ